ncbi:MAG: hypothetical protein DLM55_07705 [Acidimicrobiales bacterium]|nr:MAG: hypothetical protein DLM55_07705 [Acidimicrobiales bacterium]
MFNSDDIALIDVGGDVLANGADAGLTNLLADQLALTACVASGIPTRLIVAAPGIDGELSEAVVIDRLTQLNAKRLCNMESSDFTFNDVASIEGVFSWHPSEASGLLAAAARGHRGTVATRAACRHVQLSASTTALYSVLASAAEAATPAAALRDTCSLEHAEKIIYDATGVSELSCEFAKAKRLARQPTHMPHPADLATVDQHATAAQAAGAGADYISIRRLAELLGATTLPAFVALCALLSAERPDQYEPSIYRTLPAAFS